MKNFLNSLKRSALALFSFVMLGFSVAWSMDVPEFSAPPFLQEMSDGVASHDVATFVGAVDDFFKQFPLSISADNDKEAFYHSLVHTILFMANNPVETDVPAGCGEVDLVVKCGTKAFILEFKNCKEKTANAQKKLIFEALKQIVSHDYYQSYRDKDQMALISMVFHGPSFEKKIQGDSLQKLSAASLILRKSPVTLRAFPHATSDTSVGKHKELVELFKKDLWKSHWDDFRVKRSAPQDTSTPATQSDPKKEIAVVEDSLSSNIHNFLFQNDVSSVMEKIQFILHKIPWSLRLFNEEYFQAILYTIFLCTGLDVEIQENRIVVKTDDQNYEFICRFFDFEESDKFSVDRSVSEALFKRCENFEYNQKHTNIIVIGISRGSKKEPKSKINIISKGIRVGQKHFYQLDKTKICRKTATYFLSKEIFKPENARAFAINTPETPINKDKISKSNKRSRNEAEDVCLSRKKKKSTPRSLFKSDDDSALKSNF